MSALIFCSKCDGFVDRPHIHDIPVTVVEQHTYIISDGPKMLKETLGLAQCLVGNSDNPRAKEHVARLQRLINECERKRPTGPDGKHGSRHTDECGCDRDVSIPAQSDHL